MVLVLDLLLLNQLNQLQDLLKLVMLSLHACARKDFDLNLAPGLDLEHPNLSNEGHNHEHEHHNMDHDHQKQLLHQGSWLTC